MDESTFWRMIEDAKKGANGDVAQQTKILEENLTTLSADDIIEFEKLLVNFRFRAYTRDLWAAAYIINGGCSDDGFDYFRGWLIAQGQRPYYDALKDPETLLDVVSDDPQDSIGDAEEMLYVATKAYEFKTGRELPFARQRHPVLTGTDWDEDDLETMYPKLHAKFF